MIVDVSVCCVWMCVFMCGVCVVYVCGCDKTRWLVKLVKQTSGRCKRQEQDVHAHLHPYTRHTHTHTHIHTTHIHTHTGYSYRMLLTHTCTPKHHPHRDTQHLWHWSCRAPQHTRLATLLYGREADDKTQCRPSYVRGVRQAIACQHLSYDYII